MNRLIRANRSVLATAAAALPVTGTQAAAPPAGAADTAAAEVSPHAAQTIDNIGASGAWWVNDLQNFSPAVQAKVAKLLFSPGGLDKQSGKCLTADTSGAAIGTCTGGDAQSWSYDAKGLLRGANGCLTAGSSGLAAANCTDAPGQRWQLNANGQIVGEASGKCLDVSGQATADGSPLILYSCNGGSNEAWNRQ